MDPHRTLAGAAIATAALLLAAPMLPVAGFTSPLDSFVDEAREPSDVPPSAAPRWSPGNWWTFDVSVQEHEPVLAAIIVHEAGPDGIHVGMNRSGSILGLPFSGNFSSELNPEFAGETWKMYDFPLEAGESWDQQLLGHTLHTEVEAAELEDPDGNGTTAGFALEATSYGQQVASYTYHPEAGWFDALTIKDPGSGELLLEADLVAYGSSWDEAYYVNERIHETTITYPGTLPGERTFTVPTTYDRARVLLTAIADAGAVDAEVQDGGGRSIVTARALVDGRELKVATVEDPHGTWTLSHTGTGQATIHLEVLGVRTVDPAHRTADGVDGALPGLDDDGHEALPSVQTGVLGSHRGEFAG